MRSETTNSNPINNTLYDFLKDVLCVEPTEPLKCAVNLERILSKQVLKKLQDFILFTREKAKNDSNYVKELNLFLMSSK